MTWREGNGEAWKWAGSLSNSYLGHGSYNYRLPPGRYGTQENAGFTMWHLLAIKTLSSDTQYQFLKSASEENADTLLDDLRESMAVIPDHYRKEWLAHAGTYRTTRISWRNIREISAWKTPLEICDVLGIPLIMWEDEEWYDLELHPVIRAAQRQSCIQSGWPVDEMWH